MTNLTYDTLPQDILTPIVFDPQKAGDIAREVWRRISDLKPLAKFKFFRNAPERVFDALDSNWDIRARPDQLPPDMTSEDED